MRILDGKVALVTGGSRGIGAAIAKRLGEIGANVAFTYSKSEEEAKAVAADIEKSGSRALALKADANKPDALTTLPEKVKKEFGRLDILVNNAGVFELGMIGDIAPEVFEKSLNINVRAVFHLTNAAIAHMTDGGRIVNIGSILGQRAVGAGMGVYNMTKFAVAGLSRSWAHDLAPRNITVNTVQPGPIDTDMNPASGDFAESQKQMVPMKRYGKPADVAAAVAFFCAPENGYVTGAMMNVDGGMNA